MARALSVAEVLNQKSKTIPFTGVWEEAFGTPEWYGAWLIWGNSGNGKSSFVMQLCKELARFGNVLYNSLEEATGYTMQNTLERFKMIDVNGRIKFINESMDELSVRLLRRKSADFIVIDSLQYTGMKYSQYIAFKKMHPNKLFIFISHAKGKDPKGGPAVGVMYDAALKIWVEGHRAFSKGRTIGSTGKYTIWEEAAKKYWGE